MSEHNISTLSDLHADRDRNQAEMDRLADHRRHLQNKIRRATPAQKETLRAEKNGITEQITALRKRLKYAAAIEKRSAHIDDCLNQIHDTIENQRSNQQKQPSRAGHRREESLQTHNMRLVSLFFNTQAAGQSGTDLFLQDKDCRYTLLPLRQARISALLAVLGIFYISERMFADTRFPLSDLDCRTARIFLEVCTAYHSLKILWKGIISTPSPVSVFTRSCIAIKRTPSDGYTTCVSLPISTCLHPKRDKSFTMIVPISPFSAIRIKFGLWKVVPDTPSSTKNIVLVYPSLRSKSCKICF